MMIFNRIEKGIIVHRSMARSLLVYRGSFNICQSKLPSFSRDFLGSHPRLAQTCHELHKQAFELYTQKVVSEV